MATREDIIAEARSWIGVPFQPMGNTRKGIDCCHFVVQVGQKLGLMPSDFALPHYNSPNAELFSKYMPKFFDLKDGEPEIGDVIIVSGEFRREGWTPPPRHMFIYTLSRKFRTEMVIGVAETATSGIVVPLGYPVVSELVFDDSIKARHLSTHVWKGLASSGA